MLNVKGETNLNGNINVFKNILILMIAECVTMFVQSIVATGPPGKNEVGYLQTYVRTYATNIIVGLMVVHLMIKYFIYYYYY